MRSSVTTIGGHGSRVNPTLLAGPLANARPSDHLVWPSCQPCSKYSRVVLARGSPYSTPLTHSSGPVGSQRLYGSGHAGSGLEGDENMLGAPTFPGPAVNQAADKAPSTCSPASPASPASPPPPAPPAPPNHMRPRDLAAAEQALQALLVTPDLDAKVEPHSPLLDRGVLVQAEVVDMAVAACMVVAFGGPHASRGLAQLPSVAYGGGAMGGVMAAMAAAAAASGAVSGQTGRQLQGRAGGEGEVESGSESTYVDMALDKAPLPYEESRPPRQGPRRHQVHTRGSSTCGWTGAAGDGSRGATTDARGAHSDVATISALANDMLSSAGICMHSVLSSTDSMDFLPTDMADAVEAAAREAAVAAPPSSQSDTVDFLSDSQSDSDAAGLTHDPMAALEALYRGVPPRDAAHLFLQRALYRINRLNLFWFDALSNYCNDRSLHLARLRGALEAAWCSWEAEQLGREVVEGLKRLTPSEVKAGLVARYRADVSPPLSHVGDYITHDMGVEGYRALLAMASLDGLVEASRQSRVCGGAANEVACMVFKVLAEEYGHGRYAHKHSTFFASMMRELGLCDQPEAYLDTVPWQVLAGANHNFLLTESRRNYLRYLGGLTFFEVVGPSVYTTYLGAARRLGLSEDAAGYWGLHIKEDERHGRWMVEQVAVPLADMYPTDSWELVLGYDQEKAMAQRAADEVLRRIRAADKHGFTAVPFTNPTAFKAPPPDASQG